MGRSWFRRSLTIVAATGLCASSVVVPAGATTYRAATSGTIDDQTGDAIGMRTVPMHEPRADVTGAKAIVHGDGRLELTASVLQPTNPATDPAWSGGGSMIVWGLDTNNNRQPDYIVILGAGPELMAVVGEAEDGAAAPTCEPVPDYSAARYSVTLAASCVPLPSSFGWGLTMLYDGNHSDDSVGALDFLVGEDDLTSRPGTASDPTADVISYAEINDARADITHAGIVYIPGRIDLTARLAVPTDPRVDPAWAGGSTELGWYFDTGGDDVPDYVAALGASPDLTVTVYDIRDGEYTIACTATAGYASTGYAVTLDPACIGSPGTLWWGVATMYEAEGQAAVDVAPDDSMAGPVVLETPSPDPAVSTSGGGSGYWMITSRSEVFAFGDARPLGGGDATGGAQRVDIEPTPSGNGYWILDAVGSVIPKGDARNFGAAPDLQNGERAAAISSTPSGGGYWIFTDRGRVLSFGNAPFLGDMAGIPLNGPVLDSVVTPSGRGYWMVGSDGGIFSFGDATFSGSTGNIKLNKPVMSMAADPDGKGYWLVASDGGIFAFDAPFYGSMGATKLNKPISGIVPGAAGYLMVGEDGGIFAFGDVAFHGSLGAKPPTSPVVAVALAP